MEADDEFGASKEEKEESGEEWNDSGKKTKSEDDKVAEGPTGVSMV